MGTPSLWEKLLASLGLNRPRSIPPAAPPSQASPTTGPTWDSFDERIPRAARERVVLIRSLVADLESFAAEHNLLSELDEVRRLRATHLPKLLQSYVEIPPEYRAEVFRETGRSASFLLSERLDKVIGRLREISEMLARGQIDSFRENVRFIDMRYGNSPFD
jgi:hypothetical protein